MAAPGAPDAGTPRPRRLASLLIVAIAGLGLSVTLWEGSRPAPPPAREVPSPRQARPRPAAAARAPLPAPAVTTSTPAWPTAAPELPENPSLPESGSDAAEQPQEAHDRTPASSVDAMRGQGLRRLESALASVDSEVRNAEHLLGMHEGQCRTSASALAPRGCDGLQAQIRHSRARVVEMLAAATEDARRSWLEPGAVRRARSARNLEPARIDELLQRAARAGGT